MRLIDFKDYYKDEATCKAEYKKLRDNAGVVCKKCQGTEHRWLEKKEMYQCKNTSCNFRTSLKSGTVMENSKMSFYTWFLVEHLFTSTKNNFSALEIQRQVGHKYYEPIFDMCHKLRLVMGKRDAEYSLEGCTEMDEGYFTNSKRLDKNVFTGKIEPLKRGVGSQRKSKVLVMNSIKKVEKSLKKSKYKHESIPKYLKMTIIENVDSKTIEKEVEQKISKRTKLITDSNTSYSNLKNMVDLHEEHNVSIEDAGKVLPWVHKAISNAKSILNNVHKGVSEKYMQNYLNEYSYKFNRRYFKEGCLSRLLIASVSYTWY
jgi:hypothetical protein